MLRLLAETGGANIVVGDEVKGSITMRLRRVPWRQAIHAIADQKKLIIEENNGILFVYRRLRSLVP